MSETGMELNDVAAYRRNLRGDVVDQITSHEIDWTRQVVNDAIEYCRRTGNFYHWIRVSNDLPGDPIAGSDLLPTATQLRLKRAYVWTYQEASAIDPDDMDEWYMFGPKTVGDVAVALSRLGLADAKWTARLADRVTELRHDADRAAAEVERMVGDYVARLTGATDE